MSAWFLSAWLQIYWCVELNFSSKTIVQKGVASNFHAEFKDKLLCRHMRSNMAFTNVAMFYNSSVPFACLNGMLFLQKLFVNCKNKHSKATMTAKQLSVLVNYKNCIEQLGDVRLYEV